MWVVALGAVAVMAGWSFVAIQRLTLSVKTDNQAYLERAAAVFDLVRSETQANLRAQSRVLAEDPRLKSTLSIEGMDEATISDILNDLNSLRRSGFLLVLSPAGRVLAQSGAPELRGLDLASSSLVKKAQGTSDSVIGAWVIAGKVLDLALVNIRYDTDVIAYLVVGRVIDTSLLTAVSTSSGVGAALVIGDKVAIAPDDASLRPVFEAVAKGAEGDLGKQYLVAFKEIEESAQVRPRLLLVRKLSPTADAFGLLRWLLLVPPLILIIACSLLVVLSSQRGNRRAGGKT